MGFYLITKVQEEERHLLQKKIVKGLCKIKYGFQKKLYLGNLDAKRDWGHALDYVEAMWKMLQQKNPEDFVIATGKQFKIRDFVLMVSKKLGMKIMWKGKGLKEVGYDLVSKKTIIEIDKNYIRPLDVNTLLGDPRKARRKLKWQPKINIYNLIDEMIADEIKLIKNLR